MPYSSQSLLFHGIHWLIEENIMYLIFFSIIIWGALNLAVFLIIKEQIPGGSGSVIDGIVKPILFIQLGAGLSGFVSTLVIRLCGFRMIRERK